MILLVSLLIGVSAGLRSMTAPAVASWAIALGRLAPPSGPTAFLGGPAAPWVFTLLAVGEDIADLLPHAPSRKFPLALLGRLVTGAVSGAAVAGLDALVWGAAAGALGAVLGTFGGYDVRQRMIASLGGLSAAALEDAAALALALGAVALASH
jgi:uncharacterized membrane protein